MAGNRCPGAGLGGSGPGSALSQARARVKIIEGRQCGGSRLFLGGAGTPRRGPPAPLAAALWRPGMSGGPTHGAAPS
jgi:hypothetical protein